MFLKFAVFALFVFAALNVLRWLRGRGNAPQGVAPLQGDENGTVEPCVDMQTCPRCGTFVAAGDKICSACKMPL